jgi:biopolymer transport protein ExbB
MSFSKNFKAAVGFRAWLGIAAVALVLTVAQANAQATNAPADANAPAAAAAPAAPADPNAPAATPAAPADAAAAPAPAPAPDVAANGSETVENPYGLSALWKNGDYVARGTLIILLIMSIGTWYIMITKFVEQAQLLSQGKEANAKFWSAGSVQSGINTLGKKSAFRAMAEDGIRATEHHEGSMTDQIDLHTWVTMSLQRSVDAINNRMQGGLAFLATVGSTAPFVGLFGTVWGIYHALTAIGIAGQASIDKVAGPVGEALIMTAFGLAVAVPAVLGYNWMVRRNKAAMDRVRNFAADLHALLVTRASSTSTSTAPAARVV